MTTIVAHRGASHDAPENTIPAFQLAWQQGADAIEESNNLMTTMPFSDYERYHRLIHPPGRISMVLDTDTANEIDDPFAVIYALLSREKIDVEALYAAPYHNKRSAGPADGMEKSYQELLVLLEFLGLPDDGLVFRGSESWLPEKQTAVASDAARDLVERARVRPMEGPPLYVAAIGALTNIASAILMAPEIVSKIVVVWLGGHALHWPHTREFNLRQDISAAQTVFDSGVPLVHIPCQGVVSHLHTTAPELNARLRGHGRIGAYLVESVEEYMSAHKPGWSKVIWDIVTVAWLLNPEWVPCHRIPCPIITDQATWSFDSGRHLMLSAYHVCRDEILRDLFDKIARHAAM